MPLTSRRSETYRIGEMSALLGVTPDTLRYYEREGLLSSPSRTAGGFRAYGAGEVERLRFIKRAQAIGLSLDEIRTLIAASSGVRCHEVRDLVRMRIQKLDGVLGDLRALRRALVDAEAACTRAIDGDADCPCPVVEGDVPVPGRVPKRLERKRGR